MVEFSAPSLIYSFLKKFRVSKFLTNRVFNDSISFKIANCWSSKEAYGENVHQSTSTWVSRTISKTSQIHSNLSMKYSLIPILIMKSAGQCSPKCTKRKEPVMKSSQISYWHCLVYIFDRSDRACFNHR